MTPALSVSTVPCDVVDPVVTVVAVDYPHSLPDEEVLAIATQEERIVVAEDPDFGELVFRRQRPHRGVLFLRLPPMELASKIELLKQALIDHADRLDQFVVVTPRGARVRRTPRP